MKILSVNTGLPKTVDWEGKKVRSSIFKTRADGPQKVTFLMVFSPHSNKVNIHSYHLEQQWQWTDCMAFKLWIRHPSI